MSVFDCVKGVNITEIVCALPSRIFTLAEYAPKLVNEKIAARMSRETGFHSLRVAHEEITTADIFAEAAEKLLSGRERKEIAGLVFVTKTPDYDIPATSHILQDRLGLSNNIICIDINEGCSGFVRGLYVASLMAANSGKSILLGCGDTNSRITSPDDRATRCIYGDGAAAILVEAGEQEIPFAFSSYGDRYNTIIIENSRGRMTPNSKHEGYISLDGIEILNFSLNEVPEAVSSFLEHNKLSDDDISLYACHNANRLIVRSLADKLGIAQEKMPFTSGDTGNISSASIPLVIARSAEKLSGKVLCCGFGVGLSVGICSTDFSGTKISEVHI